MSTWDDDDDVPLAAIVKSQAPRERPPAPLPVSKQPKLKDDKKETEARQRKVVVQKAAVVEADEYLKATRRAPTHTTYATRRSLPEYFKANFFSIAAATAVILLIGGAILSDGTNFHTDESGERIDPYKVLGLPTSATDKEIKAAYRKLSIELHPDKNPDQSEEDAHRFKQVTQGYKILSDPEKKKRWLNHEAVDDKGIPSDTLTISDQTAYLDNQDISKGAWLLLAYADWSSECWELAETWEKIGKDLGRYVNVARFNFEKSPGLAKKFSTFSVPMIYSYVDGVRTPFLGEPNHANVTLFMTKSLSDEVEVIRDATAGLFLDNQDTRVKAMLFAQQGMVKLRLAFRSMAALYKHSVDFAEVTFRGADELRKVFGVVKEPAIVFVKEKDGQPLRYTGKMTHAKLQTLFEQHQHHWMPRLSEHNFRTLCGAGSLGKQPCVVYLSDGAAGPPAHVAEVFRSAALLDLAAMASSAAVDRAPTTFGWVDLSAQAGVKAALGRNKASVVALDALTKGFAPYEGAVKAEDLAEFAETFRGRLESDMDPLAGPLTFSRESRPSLSWRQLLRHQTPHLMTVIALVAAWLLWYAMHNLWSDLRSSAQSAKRKKIVDKGRSKVLEGETRKLTKWEQLQKQSEEAKAKKEKEALEREAKRIAAEKEAAQAAVREAEAARLRAAFEAKRQKEEDKMAADEAKKNKTQSSQQSIKAPVDVRKQPPALQISDGDLKKSIRQIVSAADLSTTTKSGIRNALQAKYPTLDLMSRKDLVQAEIAAAVADRMQ